MRRLRQELLRLQPARRLPGRPHDADGYWSGYRRYFVGAFPGLVLGFFDVPRASSRSSADGALHRGQLAAFATLTTFVKISAHTITTLYGAIAFSLFYWFAADAGSAAR